MPEHTQRERSMTKKLTLFIYGMLFFLAFIKPLSAQELLKENDLSKLKVETLTDADITKLKNELTKAGLSIEQAEVMAQAKGMPAGEVAKLKQRLQSMPSTSTQAANSVVSMQPSTQEISRANAQEKPKPIIFGSDLFNNSTLTFEPNLKLATPLNYILGPGDELQIGIYGVQEYNSTIAVSTEGKLTLPNAGQISVGGMPFEAAVQNIKQAMGKAYTTLLTGQSEIAVSLSKIRTIKVTIIGSKQPGNYSVSSLSTVFNALHIAGGPGENNSYRKIELIRNNKVERKIDIYRFLISGDQSDNVGLKDNDVIRIPVYTDRVQIEGQVKREGIFELLPGETFSSLLSYASGFTEYAYRSSVSLIQKTEKEMKIKDLMAADFDKYQPKSGDHFTVAKILERFENRVIIKGAVFRPGSYSFTPGLTISGLIAKADGLKEDVYLNRARLTRLKEDLSREIVNIDLKKAAAGDKSNDLELKREDELVIYSLFDFKTEYNVSIDGEIRIPGKYPYIEKLTLNDLILQAGGLTDAASKKVEIARMNKSDNINKTNEAITLINVEISPENNEQAKNTLLQPFDMISIRKMPVYNLPDFVALSGAVQYPGKYAISNKKETILDLINRAGGLTPQAASNGIQIHRTITTIEKEMKGNFLTENTREIIIPINFKKIQRNPKSKSNIFLQPGDEVKVSAYDASVKVTGNVLLLSQIPYVGSKGVRYYLSAVGGVSNEGWKRKIFVIYPNGKAATTTNLLLFKMYPKVEPGSQIVVPEKPKRKEMTAGEFVSIASILTSLAGVVIALLRTR
jgi:protein involved in polysaccharide export with SLBB domain